MESKKEHKPSEDETEPAPPRTTQADERVHGPAGCPFDQDVLAPGGRLMGSWGRAIGEGG